VIGGYIVQDRQVVRLGLEVLYHILSHFFSVDQLSMELSIIRRHYTIEIHIILSKGACFIKAAELYSSSRDNFVLIYTKDLFLLQSLYSVYYPECHTHGKGRWHCN
jgi:hypothetical protein